MAVATNTQTRQRTCIGCGKQATKGRLLRIVRTASGTVEFDDTGKASGRGAYVCSSACWEKACNTKKVPRALKCSVSAEDMQRISGHLAQASVTAL
ncbi:MAG: YlxR family protein [Coriobacteriia bacterium]|nr:YlxR family protein [Coriobacteriia bacterium]